MLNEREILNQKSFLITIERLCHQLIESHNNFSNSIFLGVQPRGSFLNHRILKTIDRIMPENNIRSGNIDISFYRDDLMRRDEPIVPQEMDINFSVEDKDIVLIDDVLFTGRTIRSALDALLNFGRPRSVELLILINRRFSRHLPIEPNYIGKTIDSISSEKVVVEWNEIGGKDRVLIKKVI